VTNLVTKNYGRVRNWGYEGLVNARLVDTKTVSFDLTLNGAIMDNQLAAANDTGFIPGPYGAGDYLFVNKVGYPLISDFDYLPLKWGDWNHDGIIEENEILV